MTVPNAPNNPEREESLLASDSIPSRGPVQVVNVYSGKASEGESGGIPAWLKEKFEDSKKSFAGSSEHGGHGYKSPWQPFVTDSLLILIFLVVVGQTAFQIFRPPPEERKDDNADRHLLMSMLTMMAARSQATVVAPPPTQSDASPKIVVMPISVPSPPASPAATGSAGKFQFEPLQIEVKTIPTSSDTGTPNPSQTGASTQLEAKSVQLPPGNPIKITVWFDADDKCKKIQDDNHPLIYFAFSNIGSSTIWIDSVVGPNLARSLDNKTLSNLLSPAIQKNPDGKPAEFIYPGETRIQSLNCADSRINGQTISRDVPGFAVLEIRYHLEKVENPLLIAQAAFFLDPPTPPTLVGDFSGVQSKPADNIQDSKP